MEIKGAVAVRDEDYFSDTINVSNSMLEVFRDSPKLFKSVFIDKTVEKKKGDAMEFGSAFHYALFFPHKFREKYAVAPEKWPQNTKDGKYQLDQFEGLNPGKIVLWPQEGHTIKALYRSCVSDPLIKKILEAKGFVEHAFYGSILGVDCRCKTDKVLLYRDGIGILDVKTSEDVTENGFAKSCANYGYHRQAAFYKALVAQNNPGVSVYHIHLVVGKSDPHEARLFELDDQSISFGWQQIRESLEQLTMCREMDSWLTPGAGRITPLTLPKYAYYN